MRSYFRWTVGLLLFTNLCYAVELAQPGQAGNETNGASPAQLLNCTSSQSQEESAARSAAQTQGLSNAEVLARLIYSESISTGYWHNRCKVGATAASDALGGTPSERIMKSIGWGVMQRVKNAKGDPRTAIYDTVFANGQFRTSFSHYPNVQESTPNPFATFFLCPLKASAYLGKSDSADQLYRQSQRIADEILKSYSSNKSILSPFKNATNFMYPQSEHFGNKRFSFSPTPPKAPASEPSIEAKNCYLNVFGYDQPCVEFNYAPACTAK